MEATKMSIDRGMNKEDMVRIYKGLSLTHKKEWNNAICSNMDEPRDYHSKWSKSARERQLSYDIPHIWHLKSWYKWIYSQNRKRLTDTENKFMVTKDGKRVTSVDNVNVGDEIDIRGKDGTISAEVKKIEKEEK